MQNLFDVQDNICTDGLPTTAGSKILQGECQVLPCSYHDKHASASTLGTNDAVTMVAEMQLWLPSATSSSHCFLQPTDHHTMQQLLPG